MGSTPISLFHLGNDPVPFLCWTEEFIAKPEPLSEDCLYLNVWTGADKKDEKLPVFVWIYGGGLVSGSANCDIYDGEEMAKKGPFLAAKSQNLSRVARLSSINAATVTHHPS